MRIQNIKQTREYYKQNTFRSVYPVYHWHKPAEKYVPAFDLDIVKIYQRKLLGILNMTNRENANVQHSFRQQLCSYIAAFDKDYKDEPFARSFYNYKGGISYAWNGNVSKVEPVAYMLTGRDAVEFDLQYGKHIANTIRTTKQYENEKLIQMEIEQAKQAYGFGGAAFVKGELGKFKNAAGQTLELHTIYQGNVGSRNNRIIKIQFFTTNGNDNPMITNGIK